MLNSSPEGDDSLPSDDSEVVRPSTASLGDSSWTRRNWPCMGWLWKLLRYGSTRSAWNSRPPSLKPRKTPTISSSGKSSSVGIGLPLPVAPLRRVRVLEAERVERVGVRAENLSDALEDLVLQDVEVEIDQRGVVVGALKAARVQRNGEAVLRVTKQVAQDGGRVLPLGQEDVDRPDGVARSVAELDEEHLAADEFVDLAALVLAVVPAGVLRPDVRLLLQLTRHLDVRRVVGRQHAFERHGQPVAVQHLAALRHAGEIDAAVALAFVRLDARLHTF